MKKILLLSLLLSLLFITGCSSTIEYHIKNNEIESKMIINFDNNSFINYLNTITNEYEDLTDENDIYQLVLEAEKDFLPTASIVDNNLNFYSKDSFISDNYNYTETYIYNFNYDEFADNYYLKNCFDSYIFREKNDYYFIQITGNYICDYDITNATIKIKSDMKVYNANNDKKKNNYYIWNIKETDNSIFFSFSKTEEENNTLNISKSKIIIGALLIAILSIIIILYKRKQND